MTAGPREWDARSYDRVSSPQLERFVADVAAELGPDPVLDYVRLNISARR